MTRYYDAGDCYEPTRPTCCDATWQKRCAVPSVVDPQIRCAGDFAIQRAFDALFAARKARPVCATSSPQP